MKSIILPNLINIAKTAVKCIIVVTCFLAIVLILYWIDKHFIIDHIQIDNFEDPPPYDPRTDKPPSMQKQTGCPDNNNIVSMCINYDGCCNNVPANECFCKHPAISICADEYKKCIQDSSILSLYSSENRLKKCQDQRGICCKLYDTINTNNVSFNAPIKMDQKNSNMCTITKLGVNSKFDDNCKMLCTTNKNCKAYSIGEMKCKLFSAVEPVPATDVFVKGPVVDINYYSKK